MKKNSKNYRHKTEKVKTAKGRKSSSTNWINRHINDPYVIMAKESGYRSRAAFKLLDIDKKYRVFANTQVIVDLGAAPGSWLQVALAKCKKAKNIIGVDLKPIEEIKNIELIQGDFLDEEVQRKITDIIDSKADLIMSDMAANSCGNKQVDHLKIIALAEEVLCFAQNYLNIGGTIICKMLRGKGDSEVVYGFKQQFKKVNIFKPDSSYKDSSEIFIIAQGLNS